MKIYNHKVLFSLFLLFFAFLLSGCNKSFPVSDLIPIACAFCDSEQIMKIYYTPGTLNSIAFTDAYIIAYINGSNILRIYNKDTKELVSEINIDLGHANCISIGNKYDESDLLPLLYVEAEDSKGTYNVVRVTTESIASIIKKFTFPSSIYGYFPQVTWNFRDGVCYSIGYDSESVKSSNSCVYVRSNINDLVQNDDDSYTPKVLFTSSTQKMMYIQDSKYYNGYIYLAHSSTTNSSAISHIYIIDPVTGKVKMMLLAPFDGEIEGLSIYKENNVLKMCVTNFYEFFEITI